MIGSTDWTGLAAVISAVGAAIAAVLAAYWGKGTADKVRTPDGVPRIGELAANVAAAVSTPPGVEPLGQVVSDTSDTLGHVHDVVCNGKPETPVP